MLYFMLCVCVCVYTYTQKYSITFSSNPTPIVHVSNSKNSYLINLNVFTSLTTSLNVTFLSLLPQHCPPCGWPPDPTLNYCCCPGFLHHPACATVPYESPPYPTWGLTPVHGYPSQLSWALTPHSQPPFHTDTLFPSRLDPIPYLGCPLHVERVKTVTDHIWG